ncbi:uncharacterized protein [Hetaerina americana]|uniref:uncharacterized protein n=1 Tax=Hetaerina americana TaxID=62018 RepID=UPI003A7F1086
MNADQRMKEKLVPYSTMRSLKYNPSPYHTADIDHVLYGRRPPVDYVIINEGGEVCYTLQQCTVSMTSELNMHSKTYGNLLESFYIGSDGIIYEGRGWNDVPHLHLKHLNDLHITIKFLGTFHASQPNDLALLAFRSLLKLGINLGTISPSYQIYSFRHIYNDSSFLGDALSEYVEGLEHWSTAMTVDGDRERESMGLLPYVSRDEWNATSPGYSLDNINGSVQYVFVGETGERCFNYSQCVHRMQNEQDRAIKLYGSLTDHFYIGDDGNVYEGLGWKELSLDSSRKEQGKAIFVRFLGRFENVLPSQLATAAFHRFMKYGLNADRLSIDYKIFSVRQLFDYNDRLANKLQLDIEKWHRYSNDLTPFNFSETISYAHLRIVQTSISFRSVTGRGIKNIPPAEYVVISDGGERCFDHKQCESQIPYVSQNVDLNENFFVGEDGRSYESFGWGSNIYSEYFFPKGNMIFVIFLGKFNYEYPSANATRAFKYLMKFGIRTGKIIPDYKLISIRQLCSNCSFVGDALNLDLRQWANWSEKINITMDCGPFNNKLVNDLQLNPYGNHYGHRLPSSFYDSIQVSNEDFTCYTMDECISLMNSHYSPSEMNFYIDGNGNVYRGLGWHWSSNPPVSNGNSAATLMISFMADFDYDFRSKEILFAFKKYIVHKGIKLGYLDPSYALYGHLRGISGNKFFENLTVGHK